MLTENGNLVTPNKHDQMVLRIAHEYEAKGYRVYVDFWGYPKPQVIGGYKPDVLATKGDQRIIVEVETTDSFKTHHASVKDAAFKRVCRRSPSTHYRRLIAR